MDQKQIIILVHLLAVGQSSTKIETRVYNEDFSVSLRGDLVTESSWTSSRVPPTLEKSLVGCASACVDKYREDLSCNSIMFDGETKECHMGNTTLADADEAAEFVYRIPDGTGKGLLSWTNQNTFQELFIENMGSSTLVPTSTKHSLFLLWRSALKSAKIVADASFGVGRSMGTTIVFSNRG